MNSRPFIPEGSKVYDETIFTTVPTQYGQQQVLVTHGIQRRVYDTTTTSIADQQGQQPFQQNYNIQNQQHYGPQIIPAQKTMYPQAVTYTLTPTQQAQANFRELGIDFNAPPQHSVQYNVQPQQPSLALLQAQANFRELGIDFNAPPQNSFQNNAQPQQSSLTLQHQIALNQLQKNALEAMMLHDTMATRPFELHFHMDAQTTTSDLVTTSNDERKNYFFFAALREMGVGTPNTNSADQLFSDCAKRKYLNTEEQRSAKAEDKSQQHSPENSTVETQLDKMECNFCETDTQTGARKVSFGEESKCKHKPRRKQKIKKCESSSEGCECRSVYDDSSDCSTSSETQPSTTSSNVSM